MLCCLALWLIYLLVELSLGEYTYINFSDMRFPLGIFDLIGTGAACMLVMALSKNVISVYTPRFNRFLMYIGKYSVIVLCFHKIERMFENTYTHILLMVLHNNAAVTGVVVYILKITGGLIAVWFVRRIKLMRKVFQIQD